MKQLALLSLVLVVFVACGDDDGPTDAGADTMTSDVGTTDAGETDAGESDAGDDAGESDAGESDAGESDAGDTDAGESDAGPDDAGADTSVADAGTDTGMDSGPPAPLGTPGCMSDDACETGVCWDFSDYDALCGGSVCSTTCAEDSECIDAATSAGADTPASATCGDDGRCSFIGTGLGIYFCA